MSVLWEEASVSKSYPYSQKILLKHFRVKTYKGTLQNNVRFSHFHRLFKSKATTAEDKEDPAQAGVNNASKGGIIYGDYLQVENGIYIVDQALSMKNTIDWWNVDW